MTMCIHGQEFETCSFGCTLDEPVCETCGGSRIKYNCEKGANCSKFIPNWTRGWMLEPRCETCGNPCPACLKPPESEFVKETQEFFRTCTDWFDNLNIPRKADLYGYKGEPAIKVALSHIQHLLNNYQNVESFRKGYLELNKRNIDFRSHLDAQQQKHQKEIFKLNDECVKIRCGLEFQLAKHDEAIRFLIEEFSPPQDEYENGMHLWWGDIGGELKHILGDQEFKRIVKDG